MEIYISAFNEEFKSCFDNIKHFVEKTGDIHDMDVLNLKLKKFLNEIRFFNKSQKSKKDHMATKPIRECLIELTKKRNNEFDKICSQIKKWEEDDFKNKILLSFSN